ncbi:MAG TPA: dTMP kinase [Planctomycetes bacterium]|nr:dTMP kinase [Planctomycetota bacterium]HIN79905.1 dTMP kinase [Planctomycetota bacterium]
MSGRFIAFEGVDGCGKSTQLQRLKERLESAGEKVVTVREPGGTHLGEAVRDILLGDDQVAISPETQMLLFLASRVQLLEELISPALSAGSVVLSDRFHLSTVIYQGYAGSVGEAPAADLCLAVLGDRRPDLNLILQLPVAECKRRLGASRDRFEMNPGFQERVAEGFSTTVGIPGDLIVRIDGSGECEEVSDRLWQEVQRVLP